MCRHISDTYLHLIDITLVRLLNYFELCDIIQVRLLNCYALCFLQIELSHFDWLTCAHGYGMVVHWKRALLVKDQKFLTLGRLCSKSCLMVIDHTLSTSQAFSAHPKEFRTSTMIIDDSLRGGRQTLDIDLGNGLHN